VSRLDSFIRRLEAQRACLGFAAERVAGIAGPVLEIGLGNGRTYDHLRSLLPGREIFAFDRQVGAHPDCVPDAAHLILGDFRETLRKFPRVMPAPAALAHADFGSGDKAATRALAAALAPLLPPLLAKGAIVVSDQSLAIEGAQSIKTPENVLQERYFVYRFLG
jgi:S-adenosyl-L-methionine methyltransferase